MERTAEVRQARSGPRLPREHEQPLAPARRGQLGLHHGGRDRSAAGAPHPRLQVARSFLKDTCSLKTKGTVGYNTKYLAVKTIQDTLDKFASFWISSRTEFPTRSDRGDKPCIATSGHTEKNNVTQQFVTSMYRGKIPVQPASSDVSTVVM